MSSDWQTLSDSVQPTSGANIFRPITQDLDMRLTLVASDRKLFPSFKYSSLIFSDREKISGYNGFYPLALSGVTVQRGRYR